MNQDRKYTIDGYPVTAGELIQQAEMISREFADDWLKTTSRAAAILRADGREVGTT